ncbi:MAG: glycoside hydrolase family 30 beta sandwich domain-containing protein [Polyangiaceae bacterium]
MRDQYYAVRHFARYTDPGYQRIACGSDAKGLLSSAWISPDEKQLTVVVLNTSKEPLEVRFSSGGFGETTSKVLRTTYRPGKSHRWADLGAANSERALRMPARSQVTVVYNK